MSAFSPAEARRLRILDLAMRRTDDPQDVVALAEKMDRFVTGADAEGEVLAAAKAVVADAFRTDGQGALGDGLERLARAIEATESR